MAAWIDKICDEGKVEDILGTVLHGQANGEINGRNCGKWHEMEDKEKVVVMVVVDKACKSCWDTNSSGGLHRRRFVSLAA